jgi:ribosomal protein S27E
MKAPQEKNPDPESGPPGSDDTETSLRRAGEAAVCAICGPTRAIRVNSVQQCEKCGRVIVDSDGR